MALRSCIYGWQSDDVGGAEWVGSDGGFSDTPRRVALFLSREVGRHTQIKFCQTLGMTNISGVSQAIKKPEQGGS